MNFRIRIEHGQDAGKTVRTAGPGIYRFGRGTELSMRVLDMKVSKEHFELAVGASASGPALAMLRELGSSHGTLINGQPVKVDNPKPIKAGDEIRVGTTILRVLSDGAADGEIQPVREAADAGTSSSVGTHTEDHSETAARLPPDELVGKTLGGYRIIQKIGKGGMGAVYLAEQVSLHRQVALKVLSEKFASDNAFVDQFLNEARAAGALNHPNVVQVYDVGEAQNHYYFSMEFVTGGSIEDKVRKGAEYTWQDALNWFIDATNALVFANRKDILHRDVKPDNLMLAEDGSAKLCDLGLAKRSENQDLMDQGIIGTPHFISPEAIRRKTTIDQRTDLYSLGCTFFRILAGENPYPGKTVKEILLGHLNKPVPRVTEHNTAIPRDLDDIVYTLMQKDQEERFQSAADLHQALDRVRVRHGLEAHGIKTGNKKLLLFLVPVLLAAIGAAIFFMNQGGKTIVQSAPIGQTFSGAEGAFRDIKGVLAEGSTTYIRRSTDLQREYDQNDITKTWDSRKAFWKDLAGKFEKLGEEADGQITAWKNEREKKISDVANRARKVLEHKEIAKHPKMREDASTFADVLSEEYDKRIEEVERVAKNAKDYASKKITAYVKKREDNREREREKKQQVIGDFTQYLDKLAKQVQTAIDENRPWEAEAALAAGVIEKKLDGSLQAAQVDGAPVLERPDLEKIALEKLGRKLDKEGKVVKEWGVEKWLEPAMQKLVDEHKRVIKEAQEAAGVKNIDGFQKAAEIIDTYLGDLPVPPEDAKGRFAERLRDFRRQAEAMRKGWKQKREELINAQLLADQRLVSRLAKSLRRPDIRSKGGSFWRFDVTSAQKDVAAALQKVKTPDARAQVEMMQRDTEAFAALLVNFASRFKENGWNDTAIRVVNDRGAERTKRVQEAAQSLVILKGGDTLSFRTLGPKEVLDRIFFYKEEARFAFAGDDFRGLAILAEMAGDEARAKAWWEKYGVDKPDAKERIAALASEMAIARTWTQLTDLRAKIDATLDSIDPGKEFMGPEDFYDERNQEEIALKLRDVMNWLNDAATLLDKLRDTVQKSDAIWALALR